MWLVGGDSRVLSALVQTALYIPLSASFLCVLRVWAAMAKAQGSSDDPPAALFA